MFKVNVWNEVKSRSSAKYSFPWFSLWLVESWEARVDYQLWNMMKLPGHHIECSRCLSSNDGELHRVHRAAHQTGPAEVHALQNPGEKFSQDHVLAASLRNRLPPGQQTYGRGGSSPWILYINARLDKTKVNLVWLFFFFLICFYEVTLQWLSFLSSYIITFTEVFSISLLSMLIKHFIITKKKTQGGAES